MHASFPRLSLDQAKNFLLAGKVIIFPTETFYALGCDAMNPDAVGLVFSLKRRALSMPLPVVIGSRDMLPQVTRRLSAFAEKLMDAFWPGPLSIVMRATPEVPDLLTANAHRIAVRFSPHPAVLELCKATGKILVASSANISGTEPAARINQLVPELLSGTAGIYASAPDPEGGLPSTVVDTWEKADGSGTVRILRPGVITADALLAAGFEVQDLSASAG